MLGWKPRSIAALNRHGAEVDCVVAAKDAVSARAKDLARGLIVVGDPADAEQVLAGLLRNGRRVREYDIAASGKEFALVTASIVGNLCGGSAIACDVALAMRDKFLQKELIRSAEVQTARCLVLDILDSRSMDVIGDYFSGAPVVLKPFAGAGSQHTFVSRSLDDLRVSLEAANKVNLGPWLAEEFVDGAELQIDGVVRDGTVRFLGISRYVQNLVEIHKGGLVAAITLPRAEYDDIYQQADQLVERSLKALGHQDGVFHLEAFIGRQGLVFSECAARIGGGRTDEMVLAGFGVDLHDEWARAVLDIPPAIHADDVATSQSVGDMNLTAPPGRIISMPTDAEVRARDAVVYAEITHSSGDTMPDCSSASHLSAGQVLISGDEPAQVEKRMRQMLTWFQANTEVTPV
ncbi:ATP-grasp domain-containing protein [Nocardia sp. NPDC004722]